MAAMKIIDVDVCVFNKHHLDTYFQYICTVFTARAHKQYTNQITSFYMTAILKFKMAARVV